MERFGGILRGAVVRRCALTAVIAVMALLVSLSPRQASAQGLSAEQIISPYFIAMLAGPINDGASVILVKKRPNFISIETPIIGCISGFGAGALAAAAPAVAMTVASGGVLAPLSAGYVANHGLFGCIVSGVGGIVGIATAAAMELYDGKPHSPYIEIIGP